MLAAEAFGLRHLAAAATGARVPAVVCHGPLQPPLAGGFLLLEAVGARGSTSSPSTSPSPSTYCRLTSAPEQSDAAERPLELWPRPG
jgi:hypothetical protein